MNEYPQGHYVYAIMDGDDPIYIGCGTKRRAWQHLAHGLMGHAHYKPLYARIKEMRGADHEPGIIIIKDGLDKQEGYASEATMIELVGSRVTGTGTLCNLDHRLRGSGSLTFLSRGIKLGHAFKAWGDWFPTLTAVSRDPRCVVSHSTLARRLAAKWLIEKAAETPPEKYPTITCWGEEFGSLSSISRDGRCLVSFDKLYGRVQAGWLAELAASTPAEKIMRGNPILCWGEWFNGLEELSRDARCKVSTTTVLNRMRSGMTPEKAAETPPQHRGRQPLPVTRPEDWNLD